jgi:hypothetical protein
MSCTVEALSGVGCGATSTTDTSFTVGAVTGSDLGWIEIEVEVVVSATGPLLLISPPDGVLATDRFGFFGLTAAADVSEPGFLSFADVAVGFLPDSPLSLPSDSSPPAALSLPSGVDPASSPAGPDDGEDEGADGEPDDESEDEEVLSVDDESDDELDEPESDGPAHATPGVVATATPTPRATAKPPTRPTYLA